MYVKTLLLERCHAKKMLINRCKKSNTIVYILKTLTEINFFKQLFYEQPSFCIFIDM